MRVSGILFAVRGITSEVREGWTIVFRNDDDEILFLVERGVHVDLLGSVFVVVVFGLFGGFGPPWCGGCVRCNRAWRYCGAIAGANAAAIPWAAAGVDATVTAAAAEVVAASR